MHHEVAAVEFSFTERVDFDAEGFSQERCGNCQRLFYLCQTCSRGQLYCSAACRLTKSAERHREANRRHQQSEEGRLDHRDRSRAYRLRHRKRVTDAGIQKIAFSDKCGSANDSVVSMGGTPAAVAEGQHDEAAPEADTNSSLTTVKQTQAVVGAHFSQRDH